MNAITFQVDGQPRPQERHRHSGRGKNIKVYDPSKYAKDAFLKKAINSKPQSPHDGPVALHVVAFFKRPKSHYGTGKNSGVLKESAPQKHIGKPDGDNLLKFIADALNKVFWTDDGRIYKWTIEKYYATCPRTIVTVVSE